LANGETIELRSHEIKKGCCFSDWKSSDWKSL